jgi:radical SAM superfamily enzyme
MSKIKAQIEVNKEQKLQNYKDQQKNISDREAVNSAWAEIKKLKEKYDRR